MFKITDEMKKRAEENKEWLLAEDMETRRTYWIAFTDKFWRYCKGNFDTRWNFYDAEIDLMYVWNVEWMTVIIDWSIRRDTIEEFLDYIEDLENRIINLNEKFKDKEKADY